VRPDCWLSAPLIRSPNGVLTRDSYLQIA